MIKKFKLEAHSWLKKLYSLKEKWCPAFSLDTFSANMKSTQRSESTDNVFHDNEAKEVRLEELQDYYSCKHSVRCLIVKKWNLKPCSTNLHE